MFNMHINAYTTSGAPCLRLSSSSDPAWQAAFSMLSFSCNRQIPCSAGRWFAGSIPAELEGTLLRNGPGLLEVGGKTLAQPLDGDGMVRQLQLNCSTINVCVLGCFGCCTFLLLCNGGGPCKPTSNSHCYLGVQYSAQCWIVLVVLAYQVGMSSFLLECQRLPNTHNTCKTHTLHVCRSASLQSKMARFISKTSTCGQQTS